MPPPSNIASEWDVQAAVYGYLTSHSALTTLLPTGANSIFDHVPDRVAFPYIASGDMTARSIATQGSSGRDIMLDIHAYSRAAGYKELKAIMAAIYNRLHQANFTITGHSLIMCEENQSDMTLENDGLTRHGVMRFRIITEPV